jgi:hypothetical protein
VSHGDFTPWTTGAVRVMATASSHFLQPTRRSNAFGLLVAGGILFVLGFAGSSVLLGTDIGHGRGNQAAVHGRA